MRLVAGAILAVLSVWATGVLGVQTRDRPLLVAVLGTRAEVIKFSPLVKLLKTYYEPLVELKVVSTGQLEEESLLPVLQEHGMGPYINLNISGSGNGNGSGLFSTKATEALMATFKLFDSTPAAIIVQGDSDTAFAGAMAAMYGHIPLVHIEAGVRTWEVGVLPCPEEFNRRAISLIAALSLAPTSRAKENLIRDGIDPSRVVVTGNTITDAVIQTASEDMTVIDKDIFATLDRHIAIEGNSGEKKKYVLVYVRQRSADFGPSFEEIIAAIKILSIENNQLDAARRVVFYCLFEFADSVYRSAAFNALAGIENVVLLVPLPHAPFVRLLRDSVLLLTNSETVQEEAASLAVYCIVMRWVLCICVRVEVEVVVKLL
jgi:UDP-N-acetylglucosamine 2-epimerase (non-hydrolysing)